VTARLAELLGTLSLATDVGMGAPVEHGLRSAIAAARVAELVGARRADAIDAYYLALMRYAGCTAGSDVAADVMGDEVAVRGALFGVDWGRPTAVIRTIANAVGRGAGPLRGAARVARTLAKMPKLMSGARSHCEVGDRIAERCGFAASYRAALFQTFERWDGKGVPDKLRGERIALAMRIAQVGEEIAIGHRDGGVEAARARLRDRAGSGLDPRVVEVAAARGDDACAPLDAPTTWRSFLDAEPGPPRTVDDDAIDATLAAIGDFADLKSRFTRAHATGVGALAAAAGTSLGLDARALRRAGYVHDVGRVAISAALWDKPGPFADAEWERVRTHAYVGERILSRAACLAAVAEIATAAHERLDGSGYHRRLGAAACTMPARVLAAADVYRALVEERAHRPACGTDEAAATLAALAARGRLCPDAVGAVLAAAGHASRPRPPRPAGLTERELDVLRLVARGRTNKEVAVALGISTKTAGNHLQHVFEKLGVTTRAGATMFAMQHGLVAG
jgi:HD-GYP domain-containing protein (c-di-GMP phosphodiesterase class II)/DNA-binding CsgD family transcriptional regulator